MTDLFKAMPLIEVKVSGVVSSSNAGGFKDWLVNAISSINKNPETDQEFHELDSAAKLMKKIEDRVKAVKENALSQTADIGVLMATLDSISSIARDFRLQGEKIVKSKKEQIKASLISVKSEELKAYCNSFGIEFLKLPSVDFAACIKGLSSISSIEEKLHSALQAAKSELNAAAENIKKNIGIIESSKHLFQDFQFLANKPHGEFSEIAKKRIADEAARIEAERDEAARIEVERIEAERIEVERDEADRLIDSYIKTASIESARVKAESPINAIISHEPAGNLKQVCEEDYERFYLEFVKNAKISDAKEAFKYAFECGKRFALDNLVHLT